MLLLLLSKNIGLRGEIVELFASSMIVFDLTQLPASSLQLATDFLASSFRWAAIFLVRSGKGGPAGNCVSGEHLLPGKNNVRSQIVVQLLLLSLRRGHLVSASAGRQRFPRGQKVREPGGPLSKPRFARLEPIVVPSCLLGLGQAAATSGHVERACDLHESRARLIEASACPRARSSDNVRRALS